MTGVAVTVTAQVVRCSPRMIIPAWPHFHPLAKRKEDEAGQHDEHSDAGYPMQNCHACYPLRPPWLVAFRSKFAAIAKITKHTGRPAKAWSQRLEAQQA